MSQNMYVFLFKKIDREERKREREKERKREREKGEKIHIFDNRS